MRTTTQLMINNLELSISNDSEINCVCISIYKWNKANKLTNTTKVFYHSLDANLHTRVRNALATRLEILGDTGNDAKEVKFINKLLNQKSAQWLMDTDVFVSV